jgi:hypothetical protein
MGRAPGAVAVELNDARCRRRDFASQVEIGEVRNDGRGLGVLDQLPQTCRGMRGIEGDHDATGLEHGQDCADQRRVVLHEHGHAVAARAALEQSACKPIGRDVQFLIGRPPTAGVECNAVPMSDRRALERRLQCLGPFVRLSRLPA